MLEVGYTQTLASPQRDAVTWLDKSNKRIRFVLIAKVRRNPLRLKIEAWRISSTGHRRTRQTRSEEPMCHEDIEISEPDIVSSPNGVTQLTIPYDHIFDEVPEPP